jgi:branched-subunit amino acid transport protein
MSPLLLVVVALLTYGSRAAAVVFLPRPGPRFETILSRIPAAIFAGLATSTLLGAATGALLVTPARSLLVCLVGGAIGYAAGALLA